MIEVIQPGMLTTIQDAGRLGSAHLGVPRSGAADMQSFALGNRLVGNDATAASLELTFGRAVFRFTTATRMVLTGAMTPARLAGRAIWTGEVIGVEAGQVLEVGMPIFGLRNYLAISGGIEAPLTLGSRATDTLSGLGPGPVKAGQMLEIGAPVPGPPTPDFVVAPVTVAGPVELGYRLGPRDDWFDSDAVVRLEQTLWEVTSESNRVGVRLSGTPLRSRRTDQLPSEGMMLGSIEVPPSGQPIVFMADHPTTGGYPVLGVVVEDSIPWLAQSPPGSRVRFVRQRER